MVSAKRRFEIFETTMKFLQIVRRWSGAATLSLGLLVASAGSVKAEEAAMEKKAPTLEQRVHDLESSYKNVAPGKVAETKEEWASEIAGPAPGHNAWQMVSTALVFFMTLPGLALFYGGLVRKKNVLSVMAQCLGLACIIPLLWWWCGYSLAFGPGNSIFGDFTTHSMLKGVLPGASGAGSAWISDSIWAMYQLAFAIIAPALIVGAVAERVKFSSLLVFVIAWMFVVYFPFAHMVWATNGLMSGILNPSAAIPAIDFAGGTVVHMTSGWSALTLCILVGKRIGFGKELMAPHSMVLCMVGTGMLWVGWYGFNAGSALAADGIAANAFVTTTLAAAAAGLTWALIEWIFRGKPSVLGFCSGIVGGLVTITPAAGFVTPSSAVLMGVLGAVVPYFAVDYLKRWIGFDDSLDAFGIHGVGGTLGAILTGVFASPEVNGAIAPLMKGLLMNQVKACAITIVWSVGATLVIGLILKKTIGLRVTPEEERQGLDLALHGETGYEH